MRLIIFCAVLSLLLAVSVASPVKTQKRDVTTSSESSESIENKNVVKDFDITKNSLSKEEAEEEQKNSIKDNKESSSSAESEEKQQQNEATIKDQAQEESSSEEDVLPKKRMAKRSFRDADYMATSGNHLKVKDEGSIKYDKYLKLKRLRRESFAAAERFIRSADADKTSEENSSEEDKKGHEGHDHSTHKHHHHHHHEEQGHSAKSDTTTTETEPNAKEDHTKTEGARRRRHLDTIKITSSEEILSGKDQDVNEVFIFSNEKHDLSEDNFRTEQLKKNNKYVLVNENNLNKMEKSIEVQASDEDYAQGCGGNNDNRDDSIAKSNEDNESAFNEQQIF